ncbi:MAG: ABC transporter ATP-binding protein/permease [Clostridiales bacterium]|nr:ABC transporter ATP-binding protein/permease [Clostridiales bacterium]
MTRLIKYSKPYIFIILGAIVLLFLQAMCDLALPDFMSEIINNGIANGDSGYIFKMGFEMLGVTICSAAFAVTVGYLAARVAAGMCRTLRKELFEKVESFSNAEFDKFSTSSLITRTTNDITQIQMLVVLLIRMMFYAPILGVGGVVHAIANSKSMSWIIFLAVIVLLCIVGFMFIFALPKFKMIQTLIDRLNQVVRENLEGMSVIRAFNTQQFEEQRFDKANRELTSTNLFVNRLMAGMMPSMMLLMNLITVLIIWVGSKQVSAFQMDVGEMMAYMQYVMQIIMAFLLMSLTFIMVPRASVSAARIADVLETMPSVSDAENAQSLANCRGFIEFKDVCFRYPGAEEDVLHNISFLSGPGQTTAFIGSTGCGKSTLLNLIPRFYDATEGEVLLDGVNIKNILLQDLRKNLGYVPQKGILFSGTIGSNLIYGDKNATEEMILAAADIAQATEIIEENPEKLDAPIAQGGTNVSGGQKQRLSIARAIVKKPQIYIFDDSFSALDFKTDAALRARLKNSTGNTTVLIVAQRISTVMSADQIIVLDQGRIVGKGTHSELMKNCEIYREIAFSQLSQEELA